MLLISRILQSDGTIVFSPRVHDEINLLQNVFLSRANDVTSPRLGPGADKQSAINNLMRQLADSRDAVSQAECSLKRSENDAAEMRVMMAVNKLPIP